MQNILGVTEKSVQIQKEDPTIDYMIESEIELSHYLAQLRQRNISRVAFDMEGDQGRINYDYSIAIFQCFDGEKSAIIDVLKIGNSPALREFLTCSDIVKVMFSCQNDIFMAQNILGCTIAPVKDISFGQKLLQLPINLSDYLNIDKREKDTFQRANWLSRPIIPGLLNYAINDVLLLLTIEQQIELQLKDAGLVEQYENDCALISAKNFIIDQLYQYKNDKFPGYSRFSTEKKKLAGTLWIFRELLGKRLNCPVGYLLSKASMSAIVHGTEDVDIMLEQELNRSKSSAKKININVIRQLIGKAKTLVKIDA